MNNRIFVWGVCMIIFAITFSIGIAIDSLFLKMVALVFSLFAIFVMS